MAANYYPPPYGYISPYLYPYYHLPHISPFVPSVSLPPSPNPPQRRVRFEDEPVRPRERTPSWHAGMAGMAPPPNPLPFPSPPMVYAQLPMFPLAPPANPAHHRRRSDSNLPQPAWVAWPAYPPFVSPYMYQQPLPSSPLLNPLLDGENPDGPLVLFDLSLHQFKPLRLNAPGASDGTAMSEADLTQPATHPGIKRMKIVCDEIPQWPIVLEPKERERSNFLSIPSSSRDAPITVGDVLVAIHRTVQLQISHVDWARLSQDKETAVARAYTRRCRTFPSAEAFEKSQGVRRVDYLLERFMFRGLVRSRAGQESFEEVKLLVGPKR